MSTKGGRRAGTRTGMKNSRKAIKMSTKGRRRAGTRTGKKGKKGVQVETQRCVPNIAEYNKNIKKDNKINRSEGKRKGRKSRREQAGMMTKKRHQAKSESPRKEREQGRHDFPFLEKNIRRVGWKEEREGERGCGKIKAISVLVAGSTSPSRYPIETGTKMNKIRKSGEGMGGREGQGEDKSANDRKWAQFLLESGDLMNFRIQGTDPLVLRGQQWTCKRARLSQSLADRAIRHASIAMEIGRLWGEVRNRDWWTRDDEDTKSRRATASPGRLK